MITAELELVTTSPLELVTVTMTMEVYGVADVVVESELEPSVVDAAVVVESLLPSLVDDGVLASVDVVC